MIEANDTDEEDDEEEGVEEIEVARDIDIPEVLPVLPVRDVVIFPVMIFPLYVGRPMSIAAVHGAVDSNRMLVLVTQKSPDVDVPEEKDLYTTGCVALIMRLLQQSDGRLKLLVHGLRRAQILHYLGKEPMLSARVRPIDDQEDENEPLAPETEALVRAVKDSLLKAVALGKLIHPDIVKIAANINTPGSLADLVAANLQLEVAEAQAILESVDGVGRLQKVNAYLMKELEVLTVQHEIQSKTQEGIERTQREYFLRQQLKAIQEQLGEGDDRREEIGEYRTKINAAPLTEEAKDVADKQLGRLERMHPDSAEAGIVRTYLDWIIELPWTRFSEDQLDLDAVLKVLNEDHYDLTEVKERIMEQLAVRKLNPTGKAPILCFVGPPGVGKTSLGRSIARAMNRKFVRMSLGGIRDEAEIRGHRRTYVGALPGRIIQGIRQSGTGNPVFMLDEVDKIGADFRGDPSSALLEALDPEQNSEFRDHYLEVPFDLSKVMFITTANLLDPIQPAFRDRMETIRLSGYTEEEKLHIARRHLLPKQLGEKGLSEKLLSISDAAIEKITREYTREAGLRNLERQLATVCRRVAMRVAKGYQRRTNVTASAVSTYLKAPPYVEPEVDEVDEVGVATGLAYTEAGGTSMTIEATAMKGTGKLTLTGQLGDVMKESAQAALSWVRSRAEVLGIDANFDGMDIHVHVPEGAVPKDGPSAGVTLCTALVSLLTGVPVKKKVAMTGEVTLRGRVLRIGGVKEKVLAARRADCRTVLLPLSNKTDVEDLPQFVTKQMTFQYVNRVDEVLAAALAAPLADRKKRGETPPARRTSRRAGVS
ncbi:MAG: endopeptidase La [Candidatus Schekmanbacteria bacterium]|nr:endopeptidase La [Candidatus Schekmanbacteria bacterium]